MLDEGRSYLREEHEVKMGTVVQKLHKEKDEQGQ